MRLSELNALHFHILNPTTNLIQGTGDNDVLIGTDGNDRIEGSTNPFGRFEDGYDILEGGQGDDVLIGGTSNSPVGGYIATLYRFGDNSGNDVILGFDVGGYSDKYTVVDRIEIVSNVNNSGIDSAQDILDTATEN